MVQNAQRNIGPHGFDETLDIRSLLVVALEYRQPLLQQMQLHEPPDNILNVAFHKSIASQIECHVAVLSRNALCLSQLEMSLTAGREAKPRRRTN